MPYSIYSMKAFPDWFLTQFFFPSQLLLTLNYSESAQCDVDAPQKNNP